MAIRLSQKTDSPTRCRSDAPLWRYRVLAVIAVLLLSETTFAQVTLHVLGIGQDTGYPQAGCLAPHCIPGWRVEKPRVSAVSLGVIDHQAGARYLFEATPDFPRQYHSFSQVHPDVDPALAGIFLTHAHIGHYTGLMYLGHEAMGASRTPVYTMPRLGAFFRDNGPWSQLVTYNNIDLRTLEDDQPAVRGNISVTPLLVPHRDEYSETVGFRIEGPERSVLFIPDIDKWERWEHALRDEIVRVDYALLDATFYDDGELPGRDMSKIPHPFIIETMSLMADAPDTEKAKVWFIHMNHTNPALWDDSDESRHIRAAGFNIAREGMTFEL